MFSLFIMPKKRTFGDFLASSEDKLFFIKKENMSSNRSQRHGLAVPRAGDRSYVTGSIHGWSRSHLTYISGGCLNHC